MKNGLAFLTMTEGQTGLPRRRL
uniref:Uncharacterized protein n=1 Tax=Anguilla anguilla TaxID=7936 RepID=A0A0E9PKU5_ANGAN